MPFESEEDLQTILDTNAFSIRIWTLATDEPLFMLAPVFNKQENKCMALSDIGCKLPRKEMPFECRALIPKPEMKCGIPRQNVESLIASWEPHQHLFEKTINRYKSEFEVIK